MKTFFVPEAQAGGLFQPGRGFIVFSPGQIHGNNWPDSFSDLAWLEVLRRPRPAMSSKGLFLSASESLGRYGQAAGAGSATGPVEPAGRRSGSVVLLGARACELRALSYLDKVFRLGPFTDGVFESRRENTTIVASDCVDCAASCCCTLVGGQPFATAGYDVNLTPLDGGVLAEVATDRGAGWTGDLASRGFAEASSSQLSRREGQRRAMTDRVAQQNAGFTFSAGDSSPTRLPGENADGWRPFAADCVECAACTNVCPTCYCFYLFDQLVDEGQFERVRTWDSCLLATYHRMAGGAGFKPTPRPRLSSRLANRVLHKFTYSPQQYEQLGCVGCGRCVDGCLGAIDIRRVVKELGQ